MGGRARFARITLTAYVRSGAVSANVPSRSNNTALVLCASFTRIGTSTVTRSGAVEGVVDVGVPAECIRARDRVVCHADDALHPQSCAPAHRCELGRLDQLLVVVRATRQHFQYIFCPEDGEEVRLQIAIDRRKK